MSFGLVRKVGSLEEDALREAEGRMGGEGLSPDITCVNGIV